MNKIIKTNQSGIINRLWFLAGLLVFLLLFFGLTKEIVNRRQVNKKISDYREKIIELQTENNALNDKIANWDKSGELELNARIKLGLEKPGEKTIVINRPASSTESLVISGKQKVINLTHSIDPDDDLPNTAKWWKYFFQ